jgi:hypothetical protein
MNKKNLSTITLAMERLEQIGTQVLECGSDVALNTNSPMKAKGILQQVPERFRIEGVESLELRSQEIQDKLIAKSNDFVSNKEIDESAMAMIDVFAQTMSKATHKGIALTLERVASTFQVKVPDDFGLHTYFDILEVYPQFVLDYAAHNLLCSYKYPRLPLPKDFIDICNPYYDTHKKWLIKTINHFHTLGKYKLSLVEQK